MHKTPATISNTKTGAPTKRISNAEAKSVGSADRLTTVAGQGSTGKAASNGGKGI